MHITRMLRLQIALNGAPAAPRQEALVPYYRSKPQTFGLREADLGRANRTNATITVVEFLLGVAASLVATVIVLAVARARRWIAFGQPAQAWNLGRRLTAAGVSNFFASRADFAKFRAQADLADYLGSADHRIDVAAYWMANGNENESFSRHVERLLREKPGMIVRFSMINPDGPYVRGIAEYMGVAVPEIRQRIISSLENMIARRAEAPPEIQGRWQVLVYSQLPLASAIMLDYGSKDTARTQLDFKLFERPRSQSFALELKAPSELYQRCSDAWMAIVDRSTPYSSVTVQDSAKT